MFAIYILLLLSAHAQVRRFDADTMAAVMAGTEPAFVKFDFPPCELCEALDPFWNQLGQAYPSLLYKVDCTRDRPVCEARSVAEVRGQPVFKFWTGSSFRRYSGEPQPKAFEKLGAAKAFQTREERWREEKFQLSGRPEPGEGEVTVVIEYCFNVRDRERAGGQVSTAHDESRYREEAELVPTPHAQLGAQFECAIRGYLSDARAPPAPSSLR